MCKDSDAYHTNSAFKKSCNDYLKMLNGGRKRGYGVRDEISCSGAAICEVLENIPRLVRGLTYFTGLILPFTLYR